MASPTLNSGIKEAEFNHFLLKIADEITNDELLRMKFLCEDHLPKGKTCLDQRTERVVKLSTEKR